MKYDYTNLSIGAPRRLAILRRTAAEWHAKHPHSPVGNVTSWRDVRFANLNSQTGLGRGLQNNKPIWATFDGPQFRNENDASDIISLSHTGWYTNQDMDGTTYGIVGSLPHGKFIAGYCTSDNDERVYYPELFDSAEDAAGMADEHARIAAEAEQIESARFSEAMRLEQEITDATIRMRECLVMRNHPCMTYVRDEIAALIETVRKNREEIATTYAKYV